MSHVLRYRWDNPSPSLSSHAKLKWIGAIERVSTVRLAKRCYEQGGSRFLLLPPLSFFVFPYLRLIRSFLPLQIVLQLNKGE
jgi:hypothetical protein